MEKIPYVIVIGDKEMESGTYTLEGRGEEKVSGLSFDEVIKFMQDKIESRSL